MAILEKIFKARRAHHILTIEDPIEFIHPVKRGTVNQRQIGRDTLFYANALKGTLPLANMIRDGKTFQIPSMMQTGKGVGMRIMDEAILELFNADAGRLRANRRKCHHGCNRYIFHGDKGAGGK